MANTIVVPGTGVELQDGDIIQIQKFPNISQILHNGWYIYDNEQTMGWYICSIPDQVINPIVGDDLIGCIIISKASGQVPPPLPPLPPEGVLWYTTEDAKQVNAAFITVPDIDARDALDKAKLPDGKLVRVNRDVDGNTKYYKWAILDYDWVEVTIDDLTGFATKTELSESAQTLDDKISAKYTKPSVGIPMNDLSDGVTQYLVVRHEDSIPTNLTPGKMVLCVPENPVLYAGVIDSSPKQLTYSDPVSAINDGYFSSAQYRQLIEDREKLNTKIESISINGITQARDGKNINIIIPNTDLLKEYDMFKNGFTYLNSKESSSLGYSSLRYGDIDKFDYSDTITLDIKFRTDSWNIENGCSLFGFMTNNPSKYVGFGYYNYEGTIYQGIMVWDGNYFENIPNSAPLAYEPCIVAPGRYSVTIYSDSTSLKMFVTYEDTSVSQLSYTIPTASGDRCIIIYPKYTSIAFTETQFTLGEVEIFHYKNNCFNVTTSNNAGITDAANYTFYPGI